MEAAGEGRLLVPCSGARLDIHFGLGRELLLCDLESAAATQTAVVWGAQSPARRQAAFDALPHVQHVVSAASEPTSAAFQAAVAGVSDALHAAASCDDDDLDAPGMGLEAAVWDLVALLFTDHGARDGYIAEALSRWTCRHATVLGAGLEADCTQCGSHMRACAHPATHSAPREHWQGARASGPARARL